MTTHPNEAGDFPAPHEILLNRLEEHGLSKTWLATHPEVPCHPQTVYAILRGESAPRSELFLRMLWVLGLDIVPTDDPRPGKQMSMEG